MISSLRVFADNRDALLLAEVSAWLQMLGKYQEKFVEGNHDLDIEIPEDISKNFPDLDRLLKDASWLSKFWVKLPLSELNTQNVTIYDFIRYHRNKKEVKKHPSGLLKLLWDAHGRGSGTEKGVLDDNSYDKQDINQTYKQVHLSSAFGYEAESINKNALSNRRYQLYRFLEDELTALKKSLNQNSPCSPDKWWEWRMSFIKRLNEDFSTTVGDTRRPINDVALWDQTAATVAFFKVELAEVLLTVWKDPFDKNNKFIYRLLRVAFDGLNFIAQSSRIGDVLARKQLIEDAFNEVKYLIEVEYPLGFEVYRDINCIVFLVPDISNLLDCQDGQNKTLRQRIEERFDTIFKGGEVILYIPPISKGSRNVFFVGKKLKEEVKPLSPTLSFLKESWKVAADKCSICQVRPQGHGAELIDAYKNNANYYKDKAQKRKMCCICMERLQGRSEDWAKNLHKTIWIDEVADINGRVALIAGKFDLKHWLNGELISTFRNPKDNCGTTFGEIDKEFNANQNKNLKDLPNFMKIVEENVVKNLDPPTIGGLNNFLIQDEDLGENEFSSIPPNDKLALAVWRKPPSFARLRRIWENTEDFWKNSVENKLKEKDIVGIVSPRLVITGDVDNPENFGDYHAYDVELKKGVETSFVYDKERGRFINVYNLRYLAKRLGLQGDKKELTNEEAAQKIKDYIEVERKGSLDLYEDLAQSGKPIKAATIRQCKVTIDPHNYLPAIPILADPEQFMALVPAEKALKVANRIRTEYEVQFSKVKNRLPLHLNIVFFNRKQPLYAVLDAAHRMLARRSKFDALWEIQSINEADAQEICAHSDGRLTNSCKRIVLKRIDANTLNQACEILVSYGIGDPDKKDVWHPYFFAETKASDAQEFSERDYHFCAPFPNKGSYEMKYLVHVIDLKEGDRIYYSPSTLDFQFLDVTTRRYGLVYENEARMLRSQESWATRPFLLEDLVVMDRLWNLLSELTSAQLQQLAGLLEDWHVRWQIKQLGDKTYEAFATYALQRAFGKRWADLAKTDHDNLNNLISWAVSGRLLDLLELYLKILKLKPEGDKITMEAQI